MVSEIKLFVQNIFSSLLLKQNLRYKEGRHIYYHSYPDF